MVMEIGFLRAYVLDDNVIRVWKTLTHLSLDELEEFIPKRLAQELLKELKKKYDLPNESANEANTDEKAQSQISEESSTPYSSNDNNKILYLNRQHPGIIVLKGKKLTLTSKQFAQLVILASNPGLCVPYDALYDGIWKDETMVEKQQISYHKSGLVRRFSQVIPKKKPRPLLQLFQVKAWS